MSKAPSPPGKPGDDEADPSMDDILASIRRILDEDQAATPPGEDVLMLDSSMLVDEGGASTPAEPSPAAIPETPVELYKRAEPSAPQGAISQAKATEEAAWAAPEENTLVSSAGDDFSAPSTFVARESVATPALVAPEAAAAAANSVSSLMRTLAAERSTVVSRGAVTIEDLVREEMRPLLKAWLDTHLPPIVERAVQAEIERVVARQAG